MAKGLVRNLALAMEYSLALEALEHWQVHHQGGLSLAYLDHQSLEPLDQGWTYASTIPPAGSLQVGY